ncbi:aldo/keto reductase [Aquimarina agarilytica]|uniref:aldo/keto reductase n=1 Tax=Aquimarina agarilytica TaxID=1087449 RepID=UPI00028956D3|nr:aldo/keto reductase [Aquimarina agarilytica]
MQINDKSNYKAYAAAEDRYETMHYKRSGKSGVQLPAISLGLWHNFSHYNQLANAEDILRTAFDHGITHFDLANNYGPPYGSAEENFGTLFKRNFNAYRDELFIATKAGYDMWPGPYGNWGSRKYLISSLDQSLKRMQLDYVDVFYHHRPDPETPLEETAIALHDIVRQGKALYIGISNYDAKRTKKITKLLKELKVPFIIHQAKYSLFERSIEKELLPELQSNNLGCIAFSPLAQGMLTNKYLNGIPKDSRAAKDKTYLQKETVAAKLSQIQQLNSIAENRDQKLSQMAIAWILNQKGITSVLVGASSSTQLKENLLSLEKTTFSLDELNKINEITLI